MDPFFNAFDNEDVFLRAGIKTSFISFGFKARILWIGKVFICSYYSRECPVQHLCGTTHKRSNTLLRSRIIKQASIQKLTQTYYIVVF
ncbi:hypothetical protein FKM82_004152 [Ascaphus truei]